MAFNSTIPITIDTVSTNLDPAWDKDFQDEIASGSTSIRKDESETLKLRIAHAENAKNVKRHLGQVIQTAVVDSAIKVRKAHLVLEFEDYPGEKAAALLLAEGFVGMLDSTFLGNLAADQL